MRVCLISPYPTPGGLPGSGVERYTEKLAGALGGAGAEVVVVAQRADRHPAEPPGQTDGGPSGVSGNVRVERAWRRGALALPTAARAALALRPDVVHVQHEAFLYGGPEGVPGLVVGLGMLKRAGAGPVVTLHQVVDPTTVDGEFVRMHRVRVPAPLARGGLVAIQQACARLGIPVVHEEAFAGVVPGATVIPLGVEGRPAPGRDPSARSLGLDPDRLTVLCFGFLSPYKGLEAALEAARLAGPEVQMVMAGGPHPRLAARDGFARDLEDRYGGVARFTGYVPQEDVPTWFGAADVVLAPYPRPFSSSGPVGLALGLGRAVLLSDALAGCMGAPAVMGVEPRPAPLAGRLLGLARRPGALRELERASASLARERTWPVVVERHMHLYEEVARGHAARGTVRAG